MKQQRIGILTFHRSYNYGAFLQCYSLVERLKQQFPNAVVEVVDYTSPRTMEGYRLKLEQTPRRYRESLSVRNQKFEESIKYLPLSPFRMCSDDYEKLFRAVSERYDVLVVGSDAVFNWGGKGLPNAYFPDDRVSSHRVSYAASCYGMDYSNMSEPDRQIIKNSLSSFSYLGVRDNATEKLVKSLCGQVPVFHNGDPSCFLDLDKLPVDRTRLKEKLERQGVDFKKPVIGLMAGSHIGHEVARHFKGRAQLVAVYEPNPYADVFLYDLNPFEWACVFGLFDVTLTHFFHGTMFSLKNETPVMAVELNTPYAKRYKTKIRDVLERLHLEDYHYTWNRLNWSRTRRLANKLGVFTDWDFWTPVCEEIERTFSGGKRKTLKHVFQDEVQSAASFWDALNQLLEKGYKQ